VFYFSLVTALAGALTLPFYWYTPTTSELIRLMASACSAASRTSPHRELPPRAGLGDAPFAIRRCCGFVLGYGSSASCRARSSISVRRSSPAPACS